MYLFSTPSGAEFLVVFALVYLIPLFFYLKTLSATLKLISLPNRKMQPSNVWLMFIPLFNIFWHFVIVNKLAESLRAEMIQREIPLREDKPAYTIGLVMCILNCFMVVPLVNAFSGLGSLICWIIYWVKVNDYKNLLLRADPTLV